MYVNLSCKSSEKKNNISINEYWTLIHSFEKQQQQLPYSKQK